MIKVYCTTESHLIELLDQLPEDGSFIRREDAARIETLPHSFSCVNAYGRVMACAGVIEIWKDRVEAWAIFHPEAGPYLVAITRLVREFLHNYPAKRIEITVEQNFSRGHRWAAVLGFKLEAPVLAQYREGQDYALYSLIK